MKKGFTLVELIAVVAILGLIAIIVYPSIGTVIRTSRESAYEDQKQIIIKAAKTWGTKTENVNNLTTDGTEYKLTVETLLDEGYITDDDIKDPRNSKKTLKKDYVSIKYESNQFTYTYEEE